MSAATNYPTAVDEPRDVNTATTRVNPAFLAVYEAQISALGREIVEQRNRSYVCAYPKADPDLAALPAGVAVAVKSTNGPAAEVLMVLATAANIAAGAQYFGVLVETTAPGSRGRVAVAGVVPVSDIPGITGAGNYVVADDTTALLVIQSGVPEEGGVFVGRANNEASVVLNPGTALANGGTGYPPVLVTDGADNLISLDPKRQQVVYFTEPLDQTGFIFPPSADSNDGDFVTAVITTSSVIADDRFVLAQADGTDTVGYEADTSQILTMEGQSRTWRLDKENARWLVVASHSEAAPQHRSVGVRSTQGAQGYTWSTNDYGNLWQGQTTGTITMFGAVPNQNRVYSGDNLPKNDHALNTAYTAGDVVINDWRFYECTQSGTSATTGIGPEGTGTGIVDGTCVWDYVDDVGPLDQGTAMGGYRCFWTDILKDQTNFRSVEYNVRFDERGYFESRVGGKYAITNPLNARYDARFPAGRHIRAFRIQIGGSNGFEFAWHPTGLTVVSATGGAPAVTLIGRPTYGTGNPEIEITTSGTFATPAKFKWRKHNTAPWVTNVDVAAKVSLAGSGMVAVFANATYTNGQNYKWTTDGGLMADFEIGNRHYLTDDPLYEPSSPAIRGRVGSGAVGSGRPWYIGGDPADRSLSIASWNTVKIYANLNSDDGAVPGYDVGSVLGLEVSSAAITGYVPYSGILRMLDTSSIGRSGTAETGNPTMFLYGGTGAGGSGRSSSLQVDTSRCLTVGSFDELKFYVNVGSEAAPSTGTFAGKFLNQGTLGLKELAFLSSLAATSPQAAQAASRSKAHQAITSGSNNTVTVDTVTLPSSTSDWIADFAGTLYGVEDAADGKKLVFDLRFIVEYKATANTTTVILSETTSKVNTGSLAVTAAASIASGVTLQIDVTTPAGVTMKYSLDLNLSHLRRNA